MKFEVKVEIGNLNNEDLKEKFQNIKKKVIAYTTYETTKTEISDMDDRENSLDMSKSLELLGKKKINISDLKEAHKSLVESIDSLIEMAEKGITKRKNSLKILDSIKEEMEKIIEKNSDNPKGENENTLTEDVSEEVDEENLFGNVKSKSLTIKEFFKLTGLEFHPTDDIEENTYTFFNMIGYPKTATSERMLVALNLCLNSNYFKDGRTLGPKLIAHHIKLKYELTDTEEKIDRDLKKDFENWLTLRTDIKEFCYKPSLRELLQYYNSLLKNSQ